MAKSKSTQQDATTDVAASAPVVLSPEDRALLIRAIKGVRGCGDIDADRYASSLGPDKAAKVVELEREGNRAAAVTIIYS